MFLFHTIVDHKKRCLISQNTGQKSYAHPQKSRGVFATVVRKVCVSLLLLLPRALHNVMWFILNSKSSPNNLHRRRKMNPQWSCGRHERERSSKRKEQERLRSQWKRQERQQQLWSYIMATVLAMRAFIFVGSVMLHLFWQTTHWSSPLLLLRIF